MSKDGVLNGGLKIIVAVVATAAISVVVLVVVRLRAGDVNQIEENRVHIEEIKADLLERSDLVVEEVRDADALERIADSLERIEERMDAGLRR